MTVRRTNRWRGLIALTLAAIAVGVLGKRPLVLLTGIIGITFALYPRLVGPPPVEVSLDRRVSDDAPAPGDDVEVTVTLTNVGERSLWDVRIIDGVPAMLPVIDGTARRATVLRPGASVTFSYVLRAANGTHPFDPATVIVRDPAGATETETTVAADTAVTCHAPVPEVPVPQQTQAVPGDIATDDGGSGIEFHGVRHYRRGDPIGRIDWRSFARSGNLVTVEFREERAASIVLLIDAQTAAYHGRTDEPHAVASSLTAASALLPAALEAHHRVGIAVVGREFGWIPPGAGPDHAARAHRMLATHPACALYPPEKPDPPTDTGISELRARLTDDVQVILLSPLTDDRSESIATQLTADGHAVTIVSPDVTAPATPGDRLAAVERDNRIATLRRADVAVIDWGPDERLGTTIVRAQERIAP